MSFRKVSGFGRTFAKASAPKSKSGRAARKHCIILECFGDAQLYAPLSLYNTRMGWGEGKHNRDDFRAGRRRFGRPEPGISDWRNCARRLKQSAAGERKRRRGPAKIPINWKRTKPADRFKFLILLVGTAGFEPATPCTPSKCATRLRHVPKPNAYGVRSSQF